MAEANFKAGASDIVSDQASLEEGDSAIANGRDGIGDAYVHFLDLGGPV
jgi:hypothetical protein